MKRQDVAHWWLWMPTHRRAHHAPIVWCVLWTTGDDLADVVDSCGHRHPTAEDARACTWEPSPLPPVGAGLVVWIRDPEYRTIGQVLRDSRKPMVQLGMPWRAA